MILFLHDSGKGHNWSADGEMEEKQKLPFYSLYYEMGESKSLTCVIEVLLMLTLIHCGIIY